MKKLILSTIITAVLAPSAMAYEFNPESGNMTFTRQIRAVSGVKILKDEGTILFANEAQSHNNAGKFKIVSNTGASQEKISIVTDKSGVITQDNYGLPTVTYFVNELGSISENENNVEVKIDKEYNIIPQLDKYESELKEGTTATIITTIKLVAP